MLITSSAQAPGLRKPVGRSLLCLRRRATNLASILCIGATLASCGGGGGGGGSSAPSGPGATQLYLSGPSGIDRGPGPNLVAVNPSSAATSTIASAGSWGNQATVAQWAAANGAATGVGIRYRVYAGTDGFLHRADLAVGSGASAPVTAQLSSGSTANFCPVNPPSPPSPPTVLNDYANPSNSVLVYRTSASTTTITCGTPGDLFTVVPLSAGANTAPGQASLTEPVDAVRDSSGAITKILVVVHSGTGTGSQVGFVTNASATPVIIGALVGAGATYSGGDFQSLGVVPQADGSAVWLWGDLGNVEAAKITGNGASAIATVYSAQDTDVIQAPALLDGTQAFVGMVDTTHPTNTLISIDTTAISKAASTVLTENTSAGAGVELIGVAGNNLVYAYKNQSGITGLNVVAKGVPNQTKGIPVWVSTNAATQTLDANNSPIIMGNGVYFCVTTANALPQAYFYSGSGSPVAVANGTPSQVLGGVVASPVSTANPSAPAYTAAIVVTLSAQAVAPNPNNPGGNAYTAATIGSYDGAGTATPIGTLPTAQTDSYQAVKLSEGPLQAGMPALLLLNGYSQNVSSPADDLFQFTPGAAGSLNRVTTNLN